MLSILHLYQKIKQLDFSSIFNCYLLSNAANIISSTFYNTSLSYVINKTSLAPTKSSTNPYTNLQLQNLFFLTKMNILLYQNVINLINEIIYWVMAMVFDATSNNISAILWLSVLLVEETGVHGENRRPAASYWQILSRNIASSTSCHQRDSNSQH